MATWSDQGDMGGWTLKMIAFNPADQSMWCVGTAGNFARWNKEKNGWEDQGGKWTLKMIAFIDGHIYGVGTEGNVGVWADSNWSTLSANNWTLKMVTEKRSQDPSQKQIWGVGTQSNAGEWISYAFGGYWKNNGNLGNWSLDWVSFNPSGELWGVGTEHNLGIYKPTVGFAQVAQPWRLKMVTWDSAGTMWGVGTDGNVGKWVP